MSSHAQSHYGYEQRDIGVRSIVKWTVGLIVFIILTLIASIFIYRALIPANPMVNDNPTRPFIRRIPPPPLLQDNVTASTDIKVMREAEDKLLNKYGVRNDRPNTMRVPIDRAIEMIIAKGKLFPPPSSPNVRASVSRPVSNAAVNRPLQGELGRLSAPTR